MKSHRPVAVAGRGETYYLTWDQVGSLRVIADASGNVLKKIDYDAFGNIISDSAPALSIPFGFAGGLYDPDTGLVRFGYRDYDPDIGRWTAKDPIFFAGGDTDLYGYVLNNPINFTDSTGLSGWWAGGTAVSALGPGRNVGVGVGWDSSYGKGGYVTGGATLGLGVSAGFETGIYGGSLEGSTITVSAGLLNWSFGIVVGTEGIGLVGAWAPGIPVEATVSFNETHFFPINTCN